jgi:hypothetical protein
MCEKNTMNKLVFVDERVCASSHETQLVIKFEHGGHQEELS